MVPLAWAANNLNSSKSNLLRVTYDTTAVSSAQAAAVLKELDKSGPGATEATVRGILPKIGVNQSDLIVRIVPASQRRGGEKIPLVIIVTKPGDVAAALAISDPGAPADKDTKGKGTK
jgi:hypothetical protein